MWPFIDEEEDSFIPSMQSKPPEQERGLLSSALHYLNMPSGAVSGGVEYLQGLSNDDNLWDAVKRGAEEQPGYNKVLRNTLGDDFMDEDPYYLGTAADVTMQALFDPLILLPPAKVATGAKAVGKATGINRALSTGSDTLKNSKVGNYIDNAFTNFLDSETKLFTQTPITWRRALSAQGPLDNEIASFAKNRSNYYDESGELVSKVASQPEEVRNFITPYVEARPDIGQFANKTFQQSESSWDDFAKSYETATSMNHAPKASAFDGISNQTRSQVLESAKAAGLEPQQVQAIFDLGEQVAALEQKYTNELLKRGIISEETAKKFAGGRHMRREYLKNEDPVEYAKMLRESGMTKEAEAVEKTIRELENRYSRGNPIKLNYKEISQRKLLTPEDMEKLGRVMDATHPLAEGGRISADLISKYDFLKDVATKYGVDDAVDGFYKLEGKGYGPLNGMHVPREVGQEIDKILGEVSTSPTAWRRIVSYWKMGKTILNPASHARNFMSNATMLNAFGGIGLHEIPIYMARAAKEMKSNGNYYQSAKKTTNIFDDTFFKTELGRHLAPTSTKSNKLQRILGGAVDKAGDLYQDNEKLGKLTAYMYGMEKLKMAPEQAGQYANKILFDYGKVPPWVKWLRESGVVPFASFPYLAGLETGRTLWNNPARIGKYYKATNTGTEEEKADRKILPDYLQPETLLSLGKGKRSINGQTQDISKYLDLKYILPFASGLDMIPGSGEMNVPPALDLASALISGKDNFTGREFITRGMSDSEKAKAMAQYTYQSLMPSFAPPIPGFSEGGYSAQKLIQGMTGETDSRGRTYTPSEAIAHTIFGLKNTPVNIPEQYYSQMKNLQRDIQAIKSDLKYQLKDQRLSEEDKKQLLMDSVSKINQKNRAMEELQNRYSRTGRK